MMQPIKQILMASAASANPAHAILNPSRFLAL